MMRRATYDTVEGQFCCFLDPGVKAMKSPSGRDSLNRLA